MAKSDISIEKQIKRLHNLLADAVDVMEEGLSKNNDFAERRRTAIEVLGIIGVSKGNVPQTANQDTISNNLARAIAGAFIGAAAAMGIREIPELAKAQPEALSDPDPDSDEIEGTFEEPSLDDEIAASVRGYAPIDVSMPLNSVPKSEQTQTTKEEIDAIEKRNKQENAKRELSRTPPRQNVRANRAQVRKGSSAKADDSHRTRKRAQK